MRLEIFLACRIHVDVPHKDIKAFKYPLSLYLFCNNPSSVSPIHSLTFNTSLRMNTLRCALAAAAVAQLAFASPIAQGMDLDALAALPPPPTYTEVIGLTAQTVAVNQASLIASVVAAVSDTPLSTAAVEKRSAAPSTTTSSTASISTTASSSTSSSTASTCWGGIKQAKGYGPTSKPDAPAAFAANPVYGSIANAAPTPAGFTQVFSNLQASSQDYGYLGYTTLTTYDTNSCAAQCQSITDCYSFNICKLQHPYPVPLTSLTIQTLSVIQQSSQELEETA